MEAPKTPVRHLTDPCRARGAQKDELVPITSCHSASSPGDSGQEACLLHWVVQNRNIRVLILDSSSTFVKQHKVERIGDWVRET